MVDRRIVRRGRRRINFPVSQSDEIPAEVRTMLANRDARAAQRNNNVNSDRLPVPVSHQSLTVSKGNVAKLILSNMACTTIKENGRTLE